MLANVMSTAADAVSSVDALVSLSGCLTASPNLVGHTAKFLAVKLETAHACEMTVQSGCSNNKYTELREQSNICLSAAETLDFSALSFLTGAGHIIHQLR